MGGDIDVDGVDGGVYVNSGHWQTVIQACWRLEASCILLQAFLPGLATYMENYKCRCLGCRFWISSEGSVVPRYGELDLDITAWVAIKLILLRKERKLAFRMQEVIWSREVRIHQSEYQYSFHQTRSEAQPFLGSLGTAQSFRHIQQRIHSTQAASC